MDFNYNTEKLYQIINNVSLFCLVDISTQRLTFLFDFRHFKLNLLYSINPVTQSEQMQKRLKQ